MSWIQLRVRPSAPDRRDAVSAALFASGSLGIHEDGDALVTQFESEGETAAARAAARAASGPSTR